MINTIIHPTPLSIRKWAYQQSKLQSMPEWDEQITTIENAELLLTMAVDQQCPQRAAVLKCLYFLVGYSVSKHVGGDIYKINLLLDKVQSSQDQIILNWVNRSRVILHDLRKFDYTEWCKGGFVERDLYFVH